LNPKIHDLKGLYVNVFLNLDGGYYDLEPAHQIIHSVFFTVHYFNDRWSMNVLTSSSVSKTIPKQIHWKFWASPSLVPLARGAL